MWADPERGRADLSFDDGGPPGTIYDVFRKLVRDAPWSETDRRRAEDLIAELQQFNVFGTIAEKLTTKGRP